MSKVKDATLLNQRVYFKMKSICLLTKFMDNAKNLIKEVKAFGKNKKLNKIGKKLFGIH